MSLIKRFLGETVVYGLSSIVGRLIGFLLLPLYVTVLEPDEYGSYAEIYAYIALYYVFFVWRFDSGYFNFYKSEKDVLSQTLAAVLGFSTFFALLLILNASFVASHLFQISTDYKWVVYCIAGVLFFDALAEIPFAHLRLRHRAWAFAGVRLTNIIVNLGLNCFFLLVLPKWAETSAFWNGLYYSDFQIRYIIISNLIASLLSFTLLLPVWLNIRLAIDRQLFKRMFAYASPLVLVSLAGISNELLDRILIPRLLTGELAERKAQLGIYSAVYKFSLIISLFTQAYRYAAEPFFYSNTERKNSPQIYAAVGTYYFIIACFGFLSLMLFLPYVALLLGTGPYKDGLFILPILVWANICLGMYYNFSVWYKLTDNTRLGAVIALIGVGITIGLNLLLVPLMGYAGAAWTTLACYFGMAMISYLWGRNYYALPYDWGKLIGYTLLSFAIWQISEMGLAPLHLNAWLEVAIHIFMLAAFLGIVYYFERNNLKRLLAIQ